MKFGLFDTKSNTLVAAFENKIDAEKCLKILKKDYAGLKIKHK